VIFAPQPIQWLVFAATVAVVAFELLRCCDRLLKELRTKWADEYVIAHNRLVLDREIFERLHPVAVEQPKARTIILPSLIEEQLNDAPEWEREDTRARAVELYEELERTLPDLKPVDRWGRVHKLLELETEAVKASV
jgi:hypothetical protein